MKRPSFQFYPADWLGNANLKRCTREEKSIWIDLMCLFHDQEEYGLIRWPIAELAAAVGEPVRKLKSLVAKGVLKGADAGQKCEPFIYTPRSGRKEGSPVTLVPEQDGPIWYSSRMVRDEYIRGVRGGETRFEKSDGPSPKPPPNSSPKAAPKPPFGDGSTSSSSSSDKLASSSSSLPTGLLEEVLALAGLHRVLRDAAGAPGLLAEPGRVLAEWTQAGLTRERILAVIKSVVGRPGFRGVGSLGYFSGAMREEAARPAAKGTEEVFWNGRKVDGEDREWALRLRLWTSKKLWMPLWGPQPGQPGCQAPPWMLVKEAVA